MASKPKAKRDLFMPWGSWAISEWPENVYPNNPERGKRLCRLYRDDLFDHGAIVRVGDRQLVVMGAAYFKWLSSHTSRVKNMEPLPCNAPAQIAKRKKKKA
jgi:hypothetical protein